MLRLDQAGEWTDSRDGPALCRFGIGEAIAGGLIAAGIGGTASAAIGAGVADAAIGAGVGAIGSAVTGGKPLIGALTGGLTGGAIGGLGGVIGDATGLGATGGDILAGAGAGAIGSAATGQNPLTGGLEGAVGGAATGLLGGGAPSGGANPVSGGPGASAASIAAPSSIDSGGTLAGATNGLAPSSGALGGGDALAAGGGDASGFPVPPIPPAGGAPPLAGATAGLSAGGGAPSGGVGSVIGGPAATQALAGTGGTNAGITGGNSISDFLSNPSGGGLGKALSSNANWLLPAALLGYEGLKSSQGLGNIPGYNQISQEAGNLQTQAGQLGSYLQTGTLPPGVQASLDQAAKSAEATIRSQYAARGMSGSSAEAADLASAQNTVATQGSQIAMQLLQTGISEGNLSSQLYSEIMNANIQSDSQLGTALATLAGAAARPTVTLQSGSANG